MYEYDKSYVQSIVKSSGDESESPLIEVAIRTKFYTRNMRAVRDIEEKKQTHRLSMFISDLLNSYYDGTLAEFVAGTASITSFEAEKTNEEIESLRNQVAALKKELEATRGLVDKLSELLNATLQQKRQIQHSDYIQHEYSRPSQPSYQAPPQPQPQQGSFLRQQVYGQEQTGFGSSQHQLQQGLGQQRQQKSSGLSAIRQFIESAEL